MEARLPPQHGIVARRSISPRLSTAIAWVLWAAGLVALAVALLAARPGSPVDDPFSTLTSAVPALSFVTVGAVLATRLPRQRIGWLLWGGGLLGEIAAGAGGLADYGLIAHPGSLPGAIWFAVVNQSTAVGIFNATILVAFLFPTGRLPSTRWRPVVTVAIVALAFFIVLSLVAPWSPDPYPQPNPLALGGTAGDLLAAATVVSQLAFAAVLVLAAAAILRRYRGAVGIERAQLRWLAFVVAIVVTAFFGGLALDALGNTNGGVPGTVAFDGWLVADMAVAMIPITIGIAILRYRLYEIDRLISRTIGYGVVTATLGSLFVGVVLGLQAILAPFTGSNALAVAGSTLLVFSLFQPLRRRVQSLVDRRFNRARYDAERILAAFAGQLRDEVDLEALEAAITATVSRTVEPVSVALWVRESSPR